MANRKGSGPATRADVSAVRDELKADVAAVQSNLAAVRKELKADIDKVAMAVVKTDAKIDRVRQELLDRMESNTSRILNAIDAFAKKGETYDQKAITHGGQLIEQTATLKSHTALKDHEGRLKSLEAKP